MIAEQKRMTEVREGSFSAFRDGRRQGLFFLTLGVQLFLLVYQLRNELMKTLERPLVGDFAAQRLIVGDPFIDLLAFPTHHQLLDLWW
jgi:hypothetical protein